MASTRYKRRAPRRVRTGSSLTFDPATRTLRGYCPSDLQMKKDELADRRRTGLWSRRRTEIHLLAEIAALQRCDAPSTRPLPVARPRARRDRPTRSGVSRASPDDSDLPPASRPGRARRWPS